MDDLVTRLETKAAMIEMGEEIAWGSEVALMREAAVELRAAQARGQRRAKLTAPDPEGPSPDQTPSSRSA